MPPRTRAILSTSASVRRRVALEWLRDKGPEAELLVLGATPGAALDLSRTAAAELGSAFGWHRATLLRAAGAVAAVPLSQLGLVPMAPLAVEAVCARLVHRLNGEGKLLRLAPIAEMPGLPRALARTLEELRGSDADVTLLGQPDLALLVSSYVDELAAQRACDRAQVYAVATAAVKGGTPHEYVGKPLLLLDVALTSARERDFVQALVLRSPDVLITVAAGDERTLECLRALSLEPEVLAAVGPPKDLQTRLFSERDAEALPELAERALVITSAPGENRECVELARAILAEAERGVPFDQMAIVLRAPQAYRAHVEEAMRRASIPTHFARGSTRPDPAGRAMLALLSCASEDLSATRFAEYLSLGEIPRADVEGRPPPPAAREDRAPAPDEETTPAAMLPAEAEDIETVAEGGEDEAVVAGTLRAPRHWERLLVDAAVIGGLDRWRRRLDGLDGELRLDAEHARSKGEDAGSEHFERERSALASLRTFALPLLEALAAFPKTGATWGEWIELLGSLATSALRRPERVERVLAELVPMAGIGPVSLSEVRLVLERRLVEVLEAPTSGPYGKVFVGAPNDVRGLCFDTVFVPGLAEKTFPQKVIEDPILPDRDRALPKLATNAHRTADERLALRLAVGAARRRVVASYPRVDLQQSRPRTPSFYALELLRAAEGKLPGVDELARRAQDASSTRIGWPAPNDAALAIDDAEYDLSILERIDGKPEAETVGAARYLLAQNPHLARALRFRAERWHKKKWYRSDGLVDPAPEARAALAAHSLGARSFSPTAIQNYASCPYRFVLQAIFRLSPRQEPESLEELDALQKGSMFHETMYELLVALRAAELLPVPASRLDDARAILDVTMAAVAKRYEEELAPAIPRVWQDAVAQIKADAVEVLRRMIDEPAWTPAFFELSFGLGDRRQQRDPRSSDDPVQLDVGLRMRGSIDLVERDPQKRLRATDFKTGKVRATHETIIGGGKTLQPVLYALVLEKMLAGEVIDGGNLYYCTSVGGYSRFDIPLDEEARESAKVVADTLGAALTEGFLPAAPGEDECKWCDYAVVCGPYEEARTKHKPKERLIGLRKLREKR